LVLFKVFFYIFELLLLFVLLLFVCFYFLFDTLSNWKVQSVSQLDHPCFAKNYIYEPRFAYSSTVSFPIQVQMQGSSNFHECMHLVKHIFEKNTACLATKCSFFGVYQPRLYNSKFLAFAHFAKVADFLALPVDAQLTDLKVASESFSCAEVMVFVQVGMVVFHTLLCVW
jgi:hypothetical protein